MLLQHQQQQQQRLCIDSYGRRRRKISEKRQCVHGLLVVVLVSVVLEVETVLALQRDDLRQTSTSVATDGALTDQDETNINININSSSLLDLHHPNQKEQESAEQPLLPFSALLPRKKKRSTGWLWGSPGNDHTFPSSTSSSQDQDDDQLKRQTNTKINQQPPEQTQSTAEKQVEDVELVEPRAYFTFLSFSTSPVVPSTTTPAPTTLSSNCICVPYYYCDEGQVVSGGVIDIRDGWPCRSILEVCCRSPRATPPAPTVSPPGPTTAPPPVTVTALPGFTPRCGTHNPNGINARILGFKDSEAQFGEYPWMAAILEAKKIAGQWVFQFLCGAVLIWPSVVVTAAHCVKGKRPDHLTIRLGEWDTQSTSEFYAYQDIRGQDIVIHPDFWGGSLYNDIALIFLEQSAILSPHIDTICLPAASPPNYDNSSCWATGWGKNAFGTAGSFQSILKEVELPIIPPSICQTALRATDLKPSFNLHSSFLCAGGLKDLDTCVGDGGGPLVCPSLIDPWRYELSGIVSWGVGCGKYGVPGAYVDVSKFRQWIDLTISSRIPTYNVNRVTISSSTSPLREGQYG